MAEKSNEDNEESDMMKAKEYLRRVRLLRQKQHQSARQLERLRESMSLLEGIRYDRDKVQTSANDNQMDGIVRLVDAEREYEADLLRYTETEKVIVEEINSLGNPDYVEVLYKRYVDGKSFEEISCEMYRSYYRTCHIHGEALADFEKKVLLTKDSKK